MAMAVKEFFVYDKTMTTAGGSPVIENSKGQRVVRMPPQQAKWFLDNGAIGMMPEQPPPKPSKKLKPQALPVMPTFKKV